MYHLMLLTIAIATVTYFKGRHDYKRIMHADCRVWIKGTMILLPPVTL